MSLTSSAPSTENPLTHFNQLDDSAAFEILFKVCHCQRWAQQMVDARPFASIENVQSSAAQLWSTATEAEILEAFLGHARIGDMNALKQKYSAASKEQGQVAAASDETIKALFDENNEYFDKFGFIFIVFASGKSADEMLAILRSRIINTREQELKNGAGEQQKITQLRLAQLLSC